MRSRLRQLGLFFFGFFLLFPLCAHALLSMELTRGVSGAIPIAVAPFVQQGATPPTAISAVVGNDLKNSGRFTVYSDAGVLPTQAPAWYHSNLGADAVVKGKVDNLGDGHYRVSFSLSDTYQHDKRAMLAKTYDNVSAASLRMLAHHISDLVYQQLTGVRGVFSTHLAYIVVERPANAPARYSLQVSDEDGYNPHALLVSPDPIMSPSWSPDGRRIAYVSFEHQRAAIYVQDVVTGRRHLVSAFPGINGAPAFSPDGRQLALVLSKQTGAPNIYLLNLASGHLRQLTHDWSINTEPAFSPEGKSIMFTSNRAGSPQVYQLNLASGAISRVTYSGNYNARPSFTHDGKHIVVLNQTSGYFNIGILNLDTGAFRVLTASSKTDNASPSVAPNGSMVLYGTVHDNRNMLAMVSTDGGIELLLPIASGDVQDPAWSPWKS